MLLPFATFSEAAAFDLEVEVSCRCRRRVAIDSLSDVFRDRLIGDTRFVCTTILPHGDRCTATPSIYIRKRGRTSWTLRDHARAMRARQPSCSPPAARSTFRAIVQRGEVAHLYDQGCALPYTISALMANSTAVLISAVDDARKSERVMTRKRLRRLWRRP